MGCRVQTLISLAAPSRKRFVFPFAGEYKFYGRNTNLAFRVELPYENALYFVLQASTNSMARVQTSRFAWSFLAKRLRISFCRRVQMLCPESLVSRALASDFQHNMSPPLLFLLAHGPRRRNRNWAKLSSRRWGEVTKFTLGRSHKIHTAP